MRLVQWDEHAFEKQLVLVFERHGKAIDDATQTRTHAIETVIGEHLDRYLPSISSSSAIPLKRSYSYIYLREMFDGFACRLVRVPEKDIVDLFANECSQAEEFAVDAMKDGLEEISFAWIFAVEQFQQLKGESMRT